jgi:hypothetical protein
MPGGRNRNKFRDPFDNAKDHGFQQKNDIHLIEFHQQDGVEFQGIMEALL